MKDTLGILLALVLVGCAVYGGWKLERYVNYKWNYQAVVQAEIDTKVKPLTERIQKLEAEVQVLKTNK